MRNAAWPRLVLGGLSVAGLLGVYTLASNAYRLIDAGAAPLPFAHLLRPDVLPPTQAVAEALWRLVAGAPPGAAEGTHALGAHLGHLAGQGVTLPGALLTSTRRVLAGLLLGAPLGLAVGALMGWKRTADDYLHPLYVAARAIPALALITYAMLWVGHGEVHLLVPVVYAVFTVAVIPAYHGVHDLGLRYIRAARALGAGSLLVFRRVVVPAAAPVVLPGLRYGLVVAWMTSVGAEMLMAEDGVGHLLVGGGLWASRLAVGVDPAAVMVGILGLALTGGLLDLVARAVIARITGWTRGRRPW